MPAGTAGSSCPTTAVEMRRCSDPSRARAFTMAIAPRRALATAHATPAQTLDIGLLSSLSTHPLQFEENRHRRPSPAAQTVTTSPWSSGPPPAWVARRDSLLTERARPSSPPRHTGCRAESSPCGWNASALGRDDAARVPTKPVDLTVITCPVSIRYGASPAAQRMRQRSIIPAQMEAIERTASVSQRPTVSECYSFPYTRPPDEVVMARGGHVPMPRRHDHTRAAARHNP